MQEDEKVIERNFHCKICNKNHNIEFKKSIIEGRDKFPFPYVFLHDSFHDKEYTEVLTILYIDKNLQIRHTEAQKLDYDSLFSKEQLVAIIKPLIGEIEILRSELETLRNEYKSLKNIKS